MWPEFTDKSFVEWTVHWPLLSRRQDSLVDCQVDLGGDTRRELRFGYAAALPYRDRTVPNVSINAASIKSSFAAEKGSAGSIVRAIKTDGLSSIVL